MLKPVCSFKRHKIEGFYSGLPSSVLALIKMQKANWGATMIPSGQKLRYFAVILVDCMAASRHVSALHELGS